MRSLAGVAAHSVAIDSLREAGVGVAELIHHAAWIDAERDEDRASPPDPLRGGQGAPPRVLSLLIGYLFGGQVSQHRGS